MRVGYATSNDDPLAEYRLQRLGGERPILLCIESQYNFDVVVNLEQLLELRAEIDRFLFLEAERPKP